MEYVNELMKKLFSRDYQFALATASQKPSVRYIDTTLIDGCFYFVTSKESQKVKEIIGNPNVSLTSRKLYRFTGVASVIGHPLDQENHELREKLVDVFHSWYFLHNDEKDENLCFVKITLESGFIYDEQNGYNIDFINQEVISFPFYFDIKLTEE